MIDAHPAAIDPGVGPQQIEDHPRSLVFVGKVRGVEEHLFIGLHRQIDEGLQGGDFALGILVQSDLADSQYVRPIEEFRKLAHHLAGEGDVLGLLGVHAEPAVVADAILGAPLRLPFRELAEVVVKAVGAAAVESHPECGLANHQAAHLGHQLQIVGISRCDVNMGIEEAHGQVRQLGS